MYVDPNFMTKKDLKAAVKRGEKVRVFAPAFGKVEDGEHSVEGPHYPEPHRWYARVKVVDRYVVEVIE